MNNISRIWLTLLSSLALAACSTQAPKNGTTIDSIRAELKQAQTEAAERPAVTPPAEISAALMPPININLGLEQQGIASNRFDVRVNDAEAREFFMGLIEGTPYNMVVHPDVKGRISLNLKNVTIPEVMATLRDVYGYEFDQTPAGFHVLPVRLQSRIFYINYLNLKRSGASEMTVSSGQISQSANKDSSSGSSSTVTENQASARINTTTEADVWSELSSALNSIVGGKEGRSVVISPQSGIVVVRAMPAELREVESFLRETQSSLQRQVILEAKVIEVQLNDGFQSGINWGKIAKSHGNENSLTLGQSGGGSIFSGTGLNTTLQGETGNLNPASPSAVDALGVAAFGGVFSAALKLDDFEAFIELLKTQGNVQVLSSPRVSTVNNQKAVIKVGQDEFFVTDVSSTTVTGASSTDSTPDITLTPFFSGIALDVTPQIGRSGNVILHIHPSVSEVTDQTKTLTIDGQAQSLPLALSTVRESDSIVYARNGQLVVIGGLMKESTTEDVASTPVLGDLPFLGFAFRHTKQVSTKSELVILLRPIVVDSGNVWDEAMTQSGRRIDALDRGFHVGGHPDVFGTEAEVR